VRRRGPIGWAYLLAGAWITLTVSLASWWLVFGLAQARELGRIGGEAERLAVVQRMLTWEGAVLIALLLGGGGALLLAIRRERARNREVREFFLSFTHDLKTALASIRLQAESLEEDGDVPADNPTLARLLQDAVRLELQLENSLFFAQADVGLLPEALAIDALVLEAARDWPDLRVDVAGHATARADRRALQSVLRNVLQNAATHGRAHRVSVVIDRDPSGVRVSLEDDGAGAPGLGVDTSRPFVRPAPTSGTGIGLYVSRRLLERMRGALACRSMPGRGFEVVLSLPEAA
jgi:signal transduction histidine kinase